MNNDLTKRTEDAMEHLAKCMPNEFRHTPSFMIPKENQSTRIPYNDREMEKHSSILHFGSGFILIDNLSLESIREIGQKIGYEVWVEPVRSATSGTIQLKWIGLCLPYNNVCSVSTKIVDDFDEAMLEALISAILDKFPKKEGE